MPLNQKACTWTLIVILALVPLIPLGRPAQAAPLGAPTLLTTIQNVGSVPTGIAVDEVHNYIYVSAMVGNHLTRINGATMVVDKQSAVNTVVIGPMGLVVNPADQRVYACNGGANIPHFSIVDGNSLTLVAGVYVGKPQMDVAFNSSQNHAFVTDFNNARVYAVNTSNQTKTSDIGNLANNPTKIALSADGKIAYVTCVSANSVDVIDTANRVLMARYFAHYMNPVGIAVNPTNGYIYVANVGDATTNKTRAGYVTVVDARNVWKKTIEVGGFWTDGHGVMGVAYNPTTDHLFVSRRGTPGHVLVYRGSEPYDYITTIQVGNNPDAFITVDQTRNLVYVTNQGSNSVSVIQDMASAAASVTPPNEPEPELPAALPPDEPSRNPCPFLSTNVSVGIMPQGIAVDDVNGKAYVANNVSQTVSRVNLSTNVVEATSGSVVFGPSAIAVHTANQKVYVANSAAGYKSISVLYGTDLGLAHYITLTQPPRYIYPAFDAERLYVLCSDGGTNTYLAEIRAPNDPGQAPSLLREIRIGAGATIGAYGLALSQDRAAAYVTCHDFNAYGVPGVVLVVDLGQGKEVAQFFTRYNQPTAILLDSAQGRFYVANEGNGTVIAMDERNLLLGSVTLGSKPRGLALNSTFRRLAVLQQENWTVSFIDTQSFTSMCVPVFLTLTVDRWIAFSPQYNRYYVSGTGGNTVFVIRDYVGDGYENDDTPDLAKYILNDTPQVHSIDPAGDVDWVKFTVDAPVTLTLVTTDTLPGSYTTILSLYGTDGTTALVTDANPIVYAFTTDGTYYARVRAADPGVGDPSYTYQLLLTGGPPPYRLYLPLVMRGGG